MLKRFLLMITLILAASLSVADQVSFNYQGQIKVHGQRFTGNGQFKFAILNTSATAILWSNDGSLATEPTASVAVPVTEGVFSVEIGGSGMTALDGSIFADRSPLKLRTWFSDGINAMEQLHPDDKLADLSLNSFETGVKDYEIYVNGASGNDANNGLTLSTAKKTVNGAVNIIPARLRCNLTVRIAPGTYTESVALANVAVAANKQLRFIGDETWTTASPSAPNVHMSNNRDNPIDNDLTVFQVDSCARVLIQGIQFEKSKWGLYINSSLVTVRFCAASTCSIGMSFDNGSSCEVVECLGTANVNYGFDVNNASRVWSDRIKATKNSFGGMRVCSHSLIFLQGSSEFTDNKWTGINTLSYGQIAVYPGTHRFGGHTYNNIQLSTMSILENPQYLYPTLPLPPYGNIYLGDTSCRIFGN